MALTKYQLEYELDSGNRIPYQFLMADIRDRTIIFGSTTILEFSDSEIYANIVYNVTPTSLANTSPATINIRKAPQYNMNNSMVINILTPPGFIGGAWTKNLQWRMNNILIDSRFWRNSQPLTEVIITTSTPIHPLYVVTINNINDGEVVLSYNVHP